jgi:protein phosphatase
MLIRYSAVTTKGMREKNDDRVLINGQLIEAEAEGTADGMMLAAVCDGVGGYPFGDEAAEIAAKEIAALHGCPITQENILEVLSAANSSVMAAQRKTPDRRRMSTTTAGVYIKGNADFAAFNIGDSKIYRLRNGYLAQISTDHTYASEIAKLGLAVVSEEENHTITRWLGDKTQSQPSISMGLNRVFQGDIFLICSDGLSDVVTQVSMEETLNAPEDLSGKRDELLCMAFLNNATDNISIVLLEVD